MWIGLDDTDSKERGCTTFICFEFINRLYRNGYCLCSFPQLIRLNPQVPWKTRGNGAVAFNIGKGEGKNILFAMKNNYSFFLNPDAKDIDVDENEIISILKEVIEEYADVDAEQTNPAFVLVSNQISDEFYNKSVHEITFIDEAINIIKNVNGFYYLYKNGRGIIGAAAAIAWNKIKDHTFELITYRNERLWKTKRYIEDRSVIEMDKEFFSTFDNYDYENRYNCIAPHSPCPILFGIRGEDVSVLPKCKNMIKSEDTLGWMIFISNQGTDDHLRKKKISEIKPFQSVIIQGLVSKNPYRKKGGHIFFSITDLDGDIIDCAAYEPTKNFRKVIEQLYIGDEIEVYGGIREEPLTVNIEKILITKLCDVFEKIENPICPRCNRHMKSRGKEKGYQCKLCKTKSNNPIFKKKNRYIKHGFYEVPVCARRHLSKPLKRMKFDLEE